jgi:hypothetical protein
MNLQEDAFGAIELSHAQEAVVAAIELIHAREKRSLKHDNNDIDATENGTGQGEPRDAPAIAGTADVRDQTMVDESAEEALHAALRQSNDDILLQEQSQLQDAILRSNLKDLPPPSVKDNVDEQSLVLLSFQRFPQEFRAALLSSSLATWLLSEGVELQPAWACPRLVLARDVSEESITEDREWWNVAVWSINEDVVHAIRLKMDPAIRPRMKDRFVVPNGASLFDVGSASSSNRHTALSHAFCGPSDWRELIIKNTFLDAPRESASSTARSKSAPPKI